MKEYRRKVSDLSIKKIAEKRELELKNNHTMKIEKKLITPSAARDLLESNVKNRALSLKTVNRYADDMLAGRWRPDTGEMIKISKTGVILDGQHRLHAVVNSKTNQFLHIATGIDDSVFDVIDTGKRRNASDALSIKGIKNHNTLPSMIVKHYTLKSLSAGGKKSLTFTNAEILDLYSQAPDFWQHVAKLSIPWYKSFAQILSPRVIGGMYSLFMKIDSKDAKDFMSQLCTGENIENNSISKLRTKLMQDKMSVQKKMQPLVKDALIIKTWNYYREDREVKLVRFHVEEEKFPKAI